MENENTAAAAANAQGLVLHALLTICAGRMPGLSDELLRLIGDLQPSHEARMGSECTELYREELEQWKVEIFNLPGPR